MDVRNALRAPAVCAYLDNHEAREVKVGGCPLFRRFGDGVGLVHRQLGRSGASVDLGWALRVDLTTGN